MSLWAEIRFAWIFMSEVVRYPTITSRIAYDPATGDIIVEREPR